MTTDRFEEFIDFTLNKEGGFVDHPNDPGGATNFGVSLRTLLKLEPGNLAEFDIDQDGDVDADDMRLMTVAQARFFYFEHFWFVELDELIAPILAAKIFDTGVNVGRTQAARFLQRAVNRFDHTTPIAVDGQFGPLTLGIANGLINRGRGAQLLGDYCAEQAKFYHGLVKSKRSREVFLLGWLNRAYALPT